MNIKEEVYKCSKCGLCQSVCPVFAALKNEKYLPRGRFNILNNSFSTSKKISQNFIDDLDICLNCNACKNFCPSNIDSALINTLLKYMYKKKQILPFSTKYKFILLWHALKKNIVKDKFYNITIRKNKKRYLSSNEDVAYFQGCFNKYINPSDKFAALSQLKKNGYNPAVIINFCCGLPYLSEGNFDSFEKNAKKIVNAVPKNIKFVVTSCDSCYQTLLSVFKNTKFKLIRYSDLILESDFFEDAIFHKPFSLEQYDGFLPIINKKYSCSLMENYFMLKHPDFAKKLLDSVFYSKEDFQGKNIVVTSCNLTKWGLIEGCKSKNIDVQILSIAEYNELMQITYRT